MENTSSEATKSACDKHGNEAPEVIYRQEWVNTHTGEQIFQKEVTEAEIATFRGRRGVVFEMVTKFYARLSVQRADSYHSFEDHPPPTATSKRFIRIRSQAIINALHCVVEYYPSQAIADDQVEIKWPYPILVHHYDQLVKFRDQCAARDPKDLCDREQDADRHLSLLLDMLDKEVMETVRAEQQRNAQGFYTFENSWITFVPGKRFMVHFTGNPDPETFVIKSVAGGSFESPPTSWYIKAWNLDFDGLRLGRTEYEYAIDAFEGEHDGPAGNAFSSFRSVDLDSGKPLDEDAQQMVKYGQIWWDQIGKMCKSYKGRTVNSPHNEVNGFVVTDLKSFYENLSRRLPRFLDDSDIRVQSSACRCLVCQRRKIQGEVAMSQKFIEYCGVIGPGSGRMRDRDFFLCPFSIPAFVLKTRTWELLHARDFGDPQYDETLIDNLVIDPKRVQSLKALAKRFIRRDAKGNTINESPWGADFIKDKGSGLVFLLHGKPGVGKTYTAECIAHYVKRPLMVLTCSDIGTDPNIVEENLIRTFKRATSWGVVLLIDETDIFIERRGTGNIVRNSLVAAFLRALEFYEGILFLTTNRVGIFDDSFISRVHVQIYYPELTDDQRQQIWDTFIMKLQKERGETITITPDVKEYIRGAEVKAARLNGREIRNAFQTAVSMAEYYAEKDEDGRTLLKDDHLRAVLELSKDFNDYIRNVHKGDDN
ncbi:unnamed protein product [Clonostachys rosea]|uniref:AAA+ ATPase domain-containing protein n=1 Tax=Bionectria ochroleuca TaxID=29856 RepID=A0ABY6U3R0_BIOOC|nr:unnamed protein product [Clonostachys rosea]